jgi:hypothetical protein
MGHLMMSATREAAKRELEARNAQREELADLLNEVAAFVTNHPEVTIIPPWDTGPGVLWRVEVAGMHSEYDDPQFMLVQLAERFGFTGDEA